MRKYYPNYSVYSNVFGYGRVTEINDNTMSAEFSDGIHKFRIPDVFDTHMETSDAELLQILWELRSNRKQEDQVHESKAKEDKETRIKRKVSERKERERRFAELEKIQKKIDEIEMMEKLKMILKKLDEIEQKTENVGSPKSYLKHPITNDDIILTKEQQGCVDYVGDKRKDLVIRSAAGGGKSLVLIERALECLEEARKVRKRNALAVFTFNHVLAQYLREWMRLKPSDEPYIFVGTLHEYLGQVYSKIPGGKLGNPAYEGVKKKCINETLAEYATKIGSDKYKTWGEKFWTSEFRWMQNMNIFDRNDWVEYSKLEREGRGSNHRMTQNDRKHAFEMFVLYQQKKRKKFAYDGNPSGDERILYLTHNQSMIPNEMKFDHIFIDEAQDQTLAKMIALKCLARKDVTVCMDANQRIYEGRWKFSQWGNPTSKILPRPFRCTASIDALAESLIAHNRMQLDEEDRTSHVMPTAQGVLPTIVTCQNEEEEKNMVIDLIRKWMNEDPNHTIAVLYYEKDLLEKIGDWLREGHIRFDVIENSDDANYSITSPGVKLCTIHTSKGLEFMRVILPQFYQGMLPQRWAIGDEEKMMQQRNVAYVGMTRAMHQLVIAYNGNKSSFIKEMDPKLYDAKTYQEVIVTDMRKPTPQYEKRVVPKDEVATERKKRGWSFD